MGADPLAKLMARGHHPGAFALLCRSQRAATAPRDVVAVHFRHIGTELLERLADFAREARLDGGLQVGVALAHDLVHDGGLHVLLLELCEGLAGIDRGQLLRISDQHQLRDTQLAHDPEQVAGLYGGGQRALVDHQDRLSTAAATAAPALGRPTGSRSATPLAAAAWPPPVPPCQSSRSSSIRCGPTGDSSSAFPSRRIPALVSTNRVGSIGSSATPC